MARRKADTTFDQFLTILQSSNDDPQKLIKIIEAIEKTIPVKGRKRMPKPDPYLGKKLKVRRINHTVVVSINDRDDNMYSGKIELVEYDENVEKQYVKKGDSLLISKRELELTGKPA